MFMMRPGICFSILSAALSVPAAALSPAEHGSRCSANSRVEWRNMTNSDQRAFVDAVKCLMDAPPRGSSNATNRYDELVWVHASMDRLIHSFGFFLAWHRYFVYGFENMLRNECGYEAPFPWWYEIQDGGDFAGSGLFTPEYFGSLPEAQPPEHEGFCVTDGAFANRTANIGFDQPRCLSRGEVKEYSALATLERLNNCQTNVTTFREHEICVANGIHISTHAAVGPILETVSASVNDPVFWMHHGFIDWEWRRWQRVAEWRSEAISGCVVLPGDQECTPVTLDTVLTSKGLFPDMPVRDVINLNSGPLCYDYDFY